MLSSSERIAYAIETWDGGEEAVRQAIIEWANWAEIDIGEDDRISYRPTVGGDPQYGWTTASDEQLADIADELDRIARAESADGIIRLLRSRGLARTQSEIADLLGVSQPTISDWLGGRKSMSRTARRLAEVLLR